MVQSMNRYRWIGIFGWALLGLSPARAQVDFKLEVPQGQFLPGERLEAVARFSNFTGQTLTLGADPTWLRFQMEEHAGTPVNMLSEVEETGIFKLDPVQRGTLRFNLTPHFKIDHPGRYRVFGVARLPNGEVVTSSAANFEIVRGTRLGEQPFGVNTPDGPEKRKFILQHVNYLNDVLLYVRCTDETESTTYNVIRLGKTVSFTKPQETLDANGRWHVLHQFGRIDYGYHVFGPDGTMELRQTYVVTDRRPQLRVNGQGKIAVTGGARRPSVDDFPVPVAELTPEPPAFKPDDTVPIAPKSTEKPAAKDVPKKSAKKP